MSALRIGIACGLIMAAGYAGYEHGLAVGLVHTEKYIGPVLYKCISTLGTQMEKNR